MILYIHLRTASCDSFGIQYSAEERFWIRNIGHIEEEEGSSVQAVKE